MARDKTIARSIVYAILKGDQHELRSALSRFLTAISAFFSIYHVIFVRYRNELFKQLRQQWHIKEVDYQGSFVGEGGLEAKGDMGYSGSVGHDFDTYGRY